MELTYDPSANIAYLRLKKKTGKVRTLAVSDELNIDLAPDLDFCRFFRPHAAQQS